MEARRQSGTARRALVPREHGAWAQMALPLVSALLVGGLALPAVLLVVATTLGFVAHEAGVVLLGGRGARVREEEGPRARRQLAVLLALAATAGGVGVALSPWPARLALGLAGLATGAVVLLAVARRERTMLGEFTVITAFVGAGAAVGLAAGAPTDVALTLALTWWLAFGASIFAVHVVLARASSKGARDHGVRHAVLVAALASGGSLAAVHLGLGWIVPAAVAPMALVSLAVCLVRFSARHLHRLGWGLAGASTLTLILLVLGLRLGPG